MTRTKLVATLAALALAAAVVLPEVAGALLAVLAQASFFVGTAFASASAWFQRNSNNTSEKVAWAILFLAGVVLVAWSLSSGFLQLPEVARNAALAILAIGGLFFFFKADDEARRA